MPWCGVSPVDLRLHFMSEYLADVCSMTELCAHYGISRKTGYKWVARYEARGPTGLDERSRRPQRPARATDPAIVEALIMARRRHPRWGGRKLVAWLNRHDPTRAWPGGSTACDLLKAHGLVPARRRRERTHHVASAGLR